MKVYLSICSLFANVLYSCWFKSEKFACFLFAFAHSFSCISGIPAPSSHVWISVREVSGSGGALSSALSESQPQWCGNLRCQRFQLSVVFLPQNRSITSFSQQQASKRVSFCVWNLMCDVNFLSGWVLVRCHFRIFTSNRKSSFCLNYVK